MFPHQQRSPNFAPCLLSGDHVYDSKDITAVISIRAHANNPWVIERLEILAAHFEPGRCWNFRAWSSWILMKGYNRPD